MLMCLLCECFPSPRVILKTPELSSSTLTGSCGYPISVSRPVRKSSSQTKSASATYSASVLDVAVHRCRADFQLTGPPHNITTQPNCDSALSTSSAQEESTFAESWIFPPEYLKQWCFVPWRNLRRCWAAFRWLDRGDCWNRWRTDTVFAISGRVMTAGKFTDPRMLRYSVASTAGSCFGSDGGSLPCRRISFICPLQNVSRSDPCK